MRKSVVVFPLWAALLSGCALFDSPETEVERKEPALEVGESSAMAPAVAAEKPKVEPAPVFAPRSWSQDDIRRMQTRLRDVGLDPGPADGVMGPKTQLALQQLQASQRAGKTATRHWDSTASIKIL